MSVPEVTPARQADLRMARLHLRLGSLELARAELEAFAGAGALDADALLDLAEVRWRTGDVSGAGVAAQAYLGEGGDEALALVIAAEASAAAGRPTEARRLANQVLERGDMALDRVFAGIPRSGVWPIEPDERLEPAGQLFAITPTRPSTVTDDSTPTAAAAAAASTEAASGGTTSGLWDETGPRVEPDGRDGQTFDLAPGPAPAISLAVAGGPGPAGAATSAAVARAAPEPAAELDAAGADLAAGRRAAAATRMAIALRLAPSLAADVLELLADVPAPYDAPGASLELVRGDAYRQVGREVEARRSYAAAAAALAHAAAPSAAPPPAP